MNEKMRHPDELEREFLAVYTHAMYSHYRTVMEKETRNVRRQHTSDETYQRFFALIWS